MLQSTQGPIKQVLTPYLFHQVSSTESCDDDKKKKKDSESHLTALNQNSISFRTTIRSYDEELQGDILFRDNQIITIFRLWPGRSNFRRESKAFFKF